MDAELKRKWVEALRSGMYEQARHGMSDGEKLCCIGVCAAVLFKTDAEGLRDIYDGDNTWNAARDIGLTDDQRRDLVDMNDLHEKSFRNIADHIEANL